MWSAFGWRRWWLGCALVLGGATSGGCRSKAQSSAPAASGSSAGLLAPLQASAWLVPLAVPGFSPAQVSVPLGAISARPIVIALHGRGDRPEWQCGSYRHVTRAQSFVLCPAGLERAGSDRFDLGTIEATERELRAALPALKARFTQHVAKGSVVLAALGTSVEHAIEVALREPSFFSRLVLVDGSTKRFSGPLVTRYARTGGKRVLFVCSGRACDDDVDQRELALRSAGVEARVLRPERGHGLDAEVVIRLAKEWDWLTRDARHLR